MKTKRDEKVIKIEKGKKFLRWKQAISQKSSETKLDIATRETSFIPRPNYSSNRAEVIWLWYPAALRLISKYLKLLEISRHWERDKMLHKFSWRDFHLQLALYSTLTNISLPFNPLRNEIFVKKTDEMFNWEINGKLCRAITEQMPPNIPCWMRWMVGKKVIK